MPDGDKCAWPCPGRPESQCLQQRMWRTLSMPKCRMRPYWTGFVARLTMLPALTAIGPSSVSATNL